LEVEKTNAANVSYAIVVKGRPPLPTTSETLTASAAASGAASATLYERC
jgi:hypothetical protein